jgi:hypothetical protein
MQISLPHNLTRAEVRRRLETRAGELTASLSADVATEWLEDDLLALTVSAMGQRMEGTLAILDSEVIVSIDLPFMMGFAEPMIAGTIREQGQKLLA